jgi:hypothetical protein
MRAMRAAQFSGYEALNLLDPPKPAVSDGRVLLRWVNSTGQKGPWSETATVGA